MSYIYFNANPDNKTVGDCVIRAISFSTNQSWERTYIGIVSTGYAMHDMPSANHVWGEYLRMNGYTRHVIPNTCPYCYTVKDFCRDHTIGEYILATGSHVIAVSNGDYYDTWDSGNEVPIYYWRKE